MMERFCYITQIVSGKTDQVRNRWKDRAPHEDPEICEKLWKFLGMTGFEAWIQRVDQEDFLIQCLEGESLKGIFENLREQISKNNPIALRLHRFYEDVLGKDYSLSEAEPHLEPLLDIALPTRAKFLKRAFFYPLLLDKEKEHFEFRQEAMGSKRHRHETMMKAFGVSHLSTWLQKIDDHPFIVIYTERSIDTPHAPTDRLKQGEGSLAWQEISSILASHTGLKPEELSPDSEWLTEIK